MNALSPFEKFKVAVLGSPVARAKRCFIFHDWSRWQVFRVGNLTTHGSVIGHFKDQERTCARCGKLQAREVRV